MDLNEQRELYEEVSTQLGCTMDRLIRKSLLSSNPEETNFKLDDITADLTNRLYHTGWRKEGLRTS